MAVIIKLPTWTTFNRIPEGTPPSGLAALNFALGTSLAVGDTNPVWADLQDLDLGGGPLTRGASLTDLAEVLPIQNANFLSYGQAQLAVTVGGDIIDMPLWLKIAEADYGDEVPSSLPNSTKQVAVLDENDEPVLDEAGEPTFTTEAKTWVEWNAVEHSGPWDGYYYIPSSAGNRLLLPASSIVPLGLAVITQAEFIKLQAANAEESV